MYRGKKKTVVRLPFYPFGIESASIAIWRYIISFESFKTDEDRYRIYRQLTNVLSVYKSIYI